MPENVELVVGEAVETWIHAGQEVSLRLTRMPGELQLHLSWRDSKGEILYARSQAMALISGRAEGERRAAEVKAFLGDNCSGEWKCPICKEPANESN